MDSMVPPTGIEILNKLPPVCVSCGRELNQEKIFKAVSDGVEYRQMLLDFGLKVCCSVQIISAPAFIRFVEIQEENARIAEEFETRAAMDESIGTMKIVEDSFDYQKAVNKEKSIEDDEPVAELEKEEDDQEDIDDYGDESE